jgi:hypothetical protein
LNAVRATARIDYPGAGVKAGTHIQLKVRLF